MQSCPEEARWEELGKVPLTQSFNPAWYGHRFCRLSPQYTCASSSSSYASATPSPFSPDQAPICRRVFSPPVRHPAAVAAITAPGRRRGSRPSSPKGQNDLVDIAFASSMWALLQSRCTRLSRAFGTVSRCFN